MKDTAQSDADILVIDDQLLNVVTFEAILDDQGVKSDDALSYNAALSQAS